LVEEPDGADFEGERMLEAMPAEEFLDEEADFEVQPT
jgi:hypothetical protein